MAKILYHAVPVPWRKEEKYAFLEKVGSVAGVKWKHLKPDKKQNWLDHGLRDEFDEFLPLGDRDALSGSGMPSIFRNFGQGLQTNRDQWVYGFDKGRVCKRVEATIDFYNDHVRRWQRLGNKKPSVDGFVNNDARRISWSSSLKKHLERGVEIAFSKSRIRDALYRPFTFQYVYLDQHLNHRPSVFPDAFPKSDSKNFLIWVKVGGDWPFFALATNKICDQMPQGGTQCFPLFTYSEDGKERHDNITPKALTLFQIFYDDDSITRADIFHYVYALLHQPAYRTRYAENLKRELPRIPFVGVVGRVSPLRAASSKSPDGAHGVTRPTFFPLAAVEKMQGDAKPDHNPKASAKLFHAFAAAGKKLADLHVNYESAKEFPLQRQENKAVKLDWRVEAMKLSKDKASLFYNDFLTLSGIPAEVYDYRLGNRSALEWVIDQYRVTRDEKGNIASDPNRMDNEQYIVRLIGQVITLSLETVKVVSALPMMEFQPIEPTTRVAADSAVATPTARSRKARRRKGVYAKPPAGPAQPGITPEQAYGDAAHFYGKEEGPPYWTKS